jgi:Asp-tRNA(Asn)/Glu-tRNA(Gln) amidotransferase A subunit family amidase
MVARLREAGALIIGKANMHEIGIGVTGQNQHYGTPRNPYAPGHYTGGSSSGPAAAVASGLCPAALGADGGGSIRIPSSFCGLVGLKPTCGRGSLFGGAPLTWSNDVYGPLAGSVADAAILYAAMAGPDPRDPLTLAQPALTLDGFDKTDLQGLTLGVYWPWFEHAAPEVVTACKHMLAGLQERGAQVREVTIPELDAARIGHLVSITSEMLAGLSPYTKAHWKDFSLEVRTNLDLALAFTSRDYLQALRIRTRTMVNFERVLSEVDAIVTPSTACTAPPIPADALPAGESDLTTLLEILRFAPPANFTGLPAISFPAGYAPNGLPIGFQAIGRPWHEHVLLRIAHVAEGLVQRRPPQVLFDLLPERER